MARRLSNTVPDTALILYTGTSPARLASTLETGARGFLLKESPVAELARAVRMVAGGAIYVDPVLAAFLVATTAPGNLGREELKILGLLSDGLTNEAIGRRLFFHRGRARPHPQADAEAGSPGADRRRRHGDAPGLDRVTANALALDEIAPERPVGAATALGGEVPSAGDAGTRFSDDRILLLDDHSDVRRVFGAVLGACRLRVRDGRHRSQRTRLARRGGVRARSLRSPPPG